MHRTAQGFHPVAGLPGYDVGQGLNDFDHRLAVEHSGDIVRDGGADLARAAWRQIAEQDEGEFASDGGKGVAVEEEKRRPAMINAKTVERFCKGQRLDSERLPVRRARRSSFRVKAMLCSTSLTRSLVDADDSVPVPVFEKLGSGLKR